MKIFHDQTAADIIGREIEVYRLCEAGFPEAHSPFPRLLWAAESGLRAIVLELFMCDLQKHKPAPEEVNIVAKQLCRALRFLHKTHVHLDLKPGNVLWSALERKAVLADFGSCEPLGSARPLQSLYCTAQYRAPELWSLTLSSSTLVPTVDIWSFGCTIWQLVTGEILFNGRSSSSIHDLVRSYTDKYRNKGKAQHSQHYWKPWQRRILQCGPHWGNLVMQCLNPWPSTRPGEVPEHLLAIACSS